MKLIPLTQGKFTKVDDESFDELNQYKWHYTHYGYAGRKSSKEEEESGLPQIILMHRQILDFPIGRDVDHRDLDKLNNTRENLRECTKTDNSRNTKKRNNKTSKYKGVCWAKDRNKWRAFIRYNDKRIAIGSFDSEKEAGIAYNEKAKEYFGEFAWLNDIK
jgi:hypothetical protein